MCSREAVVGMTMKLMMIVSWVGSPIPGQGVYQEKRTVRSPSEEVGWEEESKGGRREEGSDQKNEGESSSLSLEGGRAGR